MKTEKTFEVALARRVAGLVSGILLGCMSSGAYAWLNADQTLELHGFLDSTTHQRAHGYGLSKQRFRGQLEFSKQLSNMGAFTGISLNGTLRATYDGVYDWNSDDFGDSAGGSVFASSSGIPNGTANGLQTPWGASPVSANVGALPGGGGFGFDVGANPNAGLKKVGGELGFRNTDGRFGGGLEFFTPVQPCDVDSRGCLPGYMNASEDNLRFPEFTGEQRWLRELYLDATLPMNNGDEINFRVGRQQVVWGRTDLFRVLDQINPIDFSIQNIYEEFEDSRIPLGIFSAEWRLGATNMFEDLNFQFIWNFEKFTPHNLGQGGQPYTILQAGDLFRALANCWDNGCTVGNFASGLSPAGNLSTDFPAQTIGIRKVHIPSDREQFGFRMEGVAKSVGFSVNALTYHSQLPSLRAGIPSRNPFTADGLDLNSIPPLAGFDNCGPGGSLCSRPFVPAFDVYFPRIYLVGGSADFYVDKVKSAFRVEFAWTDGEEFADTSKQRLFSESDVIRWVVGWDRPTYIRFLNPNRTFLLSAQIFGQHLLDYERFTSPDGTGGKIGFADWQHNFIGTLLFQGFYMNDRVQPRFIQAYDVRAKAYVMSPGVDWLVNDSWRVTFAANLKFGRSRNTIDDGRTSNSFPPFTCSTGPCGPGSEHASTGARLGFEPLGRFRSGPIGMAQQEDELQLLVRYRF